MQDLNLLEYEKQRETDWQEHARVQVAEGAIREPVRYTPRLNSYPPPLRQLEPIEHWQARAVVKALFASMHGPWVASFADGPAMGRDHQRYWSVGPIYEDLYLIPHPSGTIPGFICVGYGEEPEEPWPGQLHYKRVEILEAAGDNGEAVAHFMLVKPDE